MVEGLKGCKKELTQLINFICNKEYLCLKNNNSDTTNSNEIKNQ